MGKRNVGARRTEADRRAETDSGEGSLGPQGAQGRGRAGRKPAREALPASPSPSSVPLETVSFSYGKVQF